MFFLLAQTMPDKMPETAGATVIYICIALVVCGISMMAGMMAWWGRYLARVEQRSADERAMYTNQSAEQRAMHEREQKAARESHAMVVDKMNSSHQRVIDRTYASFEKSMTKLAESIDRSNRSPRMGESS